MELNYTEIVEFAKQIWPENEISDDLYDEVSKLNRILAEIPVEEFQKKTIEQKWNGIFKAEGAEKAYKNLYRIVSALFSVSFHMHI